jgi:hypothetical protein
MVKPGPSPEYRDLLRGRITVEEYITKLKRQVDERLGVSPDSERAEELRRDEEHRRAAAG